MIDTIGKGIVATGASVGIGVVTPPSVPGEPWEITVVKIIVMALPSIITAIHLRQEKVKKRRIYGK